ncbi:hypothetical protein COCCADRAFT_30994 [Bipolaris zeicola 26-R-13]|uniref:Uncharacterized protein n=1 Tax=Cochliobolus carbonum (strain 26-R-13) TaxID=930089 RepID=W6XPS9_COCC2|nr:uncharacterized protein COCCADRAFT_30994 [Bipolaris zeicola 26-R-13]EUC27548.1 hypothetical protein COCCADRAFT_30994 [Bipolaris zeicola 26-R-13]
MERSQEPAPPPYPGEGPSQNRQWRVRNAKYRSNFTTQGEPSQIDFREHLECLRDSLNGYTLGVGCPTDNSHVIEVQHSQAFAHVERFIEEYQSFVQQIRPLSEEDILFLILSRYATSSGASVYTEIRHDDDVNVFDSKVTEPLHTDSAEGYLVHGSGVVHSELALRAAEEAPVSLKTPPQGLLLHDQASITRTCYGAEFGGSVTLNFPAIRANDEPYKDTMGSSSSPPVFENSHPTNVSHIDWAQIPEKLQPPMFRVHRCHHRGIARFDEEIELPFGFPEVVQHFHDTPSTVYHTGCCVNINAMQSCPRGQEGLASFECYILSSDVRIYITVERDGDSLFYNCYRDKEVLEVFGSLPITPIKTVADVTTVGAFM